MPLGAVPPAATAVVHHLVGVASTPPVLLAQEDTQAVTMLRLFLIAAVLISPYWGPKAWRWWKARAATRAERRAANLPAAPVHEPGSVGAALAEFEAKVAEGADEVTVVIPAGATIDGRVPDPVVLDTVLHDAIARSGFRIVDDTGPANGATAERRITCRRQTA